jgi:hypothetical protein
MQPAQDSSSSSSSGSASDAPVTNAQFSAMLAQFAQSQSENIHQQVQSALQQFQQHQQQQHYVPPPPPTAPQATHASSAANIPSMSNFHHASPLTAVPIHIKLAKPNHYNGALSTNVDTWLFEMEQYLAGSFVNDDAARITIASTYLRDLASTWWYQICQVERAPPTTWVEFKEALKSRFQPIAAARTARANLRNLKQGGKSVAEYCNAFYKQVQLISDMSEADKIDNFVSGLNSVIAREVDYRDPTQLQGAMTFAQAAELRMRNHRSNNYQHHYSNYNRDRYPSSNRSNYDSRTTTSTTTTNSAPMELSNVNLTSADSVDENYDADYEKYLEEGDLYERDTGVNDADPEDAQAADAEQEAEEQLQAMYSNSNQRSSHSTNQRGRVPNLSREEFIRLMKERKCLRCKKPGHIARNCPQPRRSN